MLSHVAVLAVIFGGSAYALVSIDAADAGFIWRSCVLGLALLVLSAIDLDTYRLPDWLTVPMAIAGCLMASDLTASGIGWRIFSMLMGYLSLFLVSWGFQRTRGYAGLGLGDAKLFGASGAWLGAEALPVVLLIASISALIAALAVALAGGVVDRRSRVPFGPFLAVGTWIVWLAGPLGWPV